jgi:hypothetical protein
VSPIGLVDIYPSEPRNTDPRAVPSRAGSKRLSRLSVTVGFHARPRPVPTSHRPRVRLGVTDRSHRYLPICAEKRRSARRSIARERQTSQARLTRIRVSVGCHARPRPVTPRHRPRVRLGVFDWSRRYLPIFAEKRRSARRSIARERQTSQSRSPLG